MDEQELKEKIARIIAKHLCKNKYSHFQLYGDSANCYSRENFAECEAIADTVDALIAAGIGDVSEWKHRAEVAEKALRNAAPRLNCRGGLGKGFCRVDKCDYYHCNNDEGCVKAHLQQAEKELAEE